MDEVKNPYAPGAGTQPPELAGRADYLERARVTLARAKLGRPTKSFIAVGLRGIGKTVLLNRVRDLATDAGVRTSMIEAHEQKPLPQLLAPEIRRMLLEFDRLGVLNAQVKRSLRVLKSFLSAVKLRVGEAELALDINGEEGAADSGDLEADLPELFVALARAARERETAVALIIDELQYLSTKEMSALILSLHKVAQLGLPLIMFGAGLPQVVGLTGQSKSYAERLFDFPSIDALNELEARSALAEPAEAEGARFDDLALKQLFEVTQGYPYFIQVWGYHTWNEAPRPTITSADVEKATPGALQSLDQGFFRVRLDRLTSREKDYLRAMAELGPGPHRSGDIAEVLGISVTSAGPLRSGLIGKGMIFGPAHGDTAFTVPMFDEFMRRSIANPPQPRR